MTSRSSTFDRALAEFAQKISELTQTAVDNRKYVLVEKLQAWMREPSSSQLDKQYRTNTERLLRAAYPTKDFLPIEPWRINGKGHKCSLVVFSILLDLGLENWIATFAEKGILDSKLPFDLHSLERKLSGLTGGDDAAERFNERQWKFCPAIFGLGMEEDYVENQIIPICRKSEINTGGTARVDQIVMQAEFVDPSLRSKLQNDHFASYEDSTYGPCFIFALKVFEQGSFQYYTDEKAAFDGLRENRGVIHRLGCYTHQTLIPSQPTTGQANGERQRFERKTTKNLLLEYGTYDLRLIFGHKSPPVFPKEILGFWE
ncbi:hypothetical protein IQ07DRAFT_380568 [Pyrenochaeta sp. DS3sAY3a]|nr:hypothetical protein IQ07DRAFT_380568 [Pyrenochaeta sp. DS3sAY3a]